MPENTKRIQSALISVFHKDGLEPIVRELHRLGVTLYSTGGTRTFMEGLGIAVVPVEQLTSFPSILGGRVKTLHPKVFGGILGRRGLEGDREQMEEHAIPPIDLVIVDLYPFEATVAAGGTEQEIIEKIDIGGISLIRAAAKNHADVLIVPAQRHYAEVLEMLRSNDGYTTKAQRQRFATFAFGESAHYDQAIHAWFSGEAAPETVPQSQQTTPLRYGENPHQKAEFIGELDLLFKRLNGKELSYNNLLDLDAATALVDDLAKLGGTAFAVIKHNNACGAAVRPSLMEAWEAALAGDPVSAFGGVLVTTATVDKATAEAIDTIFFEIIVAPGFHPDALSVLQKKKNRIILQRQAHVPPQRLLRTALNGILSQEPDQCTESAGDMKPVTHKAPTADELRDLVFANILVKHTKSNAITLASNQQLLASGTGQTSRVDALEHAISKAKKFNFTLQGAVMASDAFFPFPDCVAIAAQAGITAIVQPGGSIRDQDSIDACNNLGIALCITGNRHFKH